MLVQINKVIKTKQKKTNCLLSHLLFFVCFDFDYAHFTIGEVFFGVLCNLFGVRGRDTGVVLGATFTFFGVAIRLGDGDDFVAAVVVVLFP